MAKKQLASDIVMNELLWYGGEQKTRKAIYDELLAEGFEKRYVDFYLFSLSQHQPKDGQSQEDSHERSTLYQSNGTRPGIER